MLLNQEINAVNQEMASEFRGSVCPPSRALLVNLKYHPYKAYWFLHWHNFSPFGLPMRVLSPECQGLFNSLEVPFGEHLYHTTVFHESQDKRKFKVIITHSVKPVQFSLE